MKSIRDLQKRSVNLTGIVPGTVEDVPNDDKSGTKPVEENTKIQTVEATSEKYETKSHTYNNRVENTTNENLEVIEPSVLIEKIETDENRYIPSENDTNDPKREKKMIKENVSSIPFVKKDVLQLLLSKERQFNNSNKPIVIDTELKSITKFSTYLASLLYCSPVSTNPL